MCKEGCHEHWKAKVCIPCSEPNCSKPTGSTSGRCPLHVKEYYVIQYYNKLRDKAQRLDLLNTYVKERLYYLVLEYANQGNLREYINVKNCNENGFEWTERLQSMSLEPIFEGDDDKNSIYLLPPSDTSKNSISAPFKKHQFEAADRRVRDQPLGTRPSQLSKDNVKIVVESINVAEAYSGTTSFRFTNRSLQFDFSLPKPKNAIEKSLYFNGEGLLDE
ncbi:hypothetical protein RhiirC2_868659 [Rhizophagus irregularis]|uniref:Uncharacterized protein n=1 Tax=Rhizophagus irregularis TaxID=588596 RepID=A0A2N1MVU8_9GLOM|nr:hypothetical protein RhiirC2_868659 [Rhizophagus irregularis]